MAPDLRTAYEDLAGLLTALPEEQGWAATGCTGWCVRDLVFHLLADAQRALVTVHTPAGRAADTDAVDYWRARDAGARGKAGPGGDAVLRATRACATAFSSLAGLAGLYADTVAAALHAVEGADPRLVVATQGHALTVPDLATTLVVEAAVHHLDLVVALERPGPGPGPLAVVRRTAEALLGEPFPAGLDDMQVARLAGGRAKPPAALADRLPVLG